MSGKVDFFVLNELFLNLGAISSVSELQGMLCGRLAAGGEVSSEQWPDMALEYMDIDHIHLADDQRSQVDELFHMTLRLIEDVNFGFVPLLPDEDASIERRAQELGAWSEGFLHGLGASGLSGDETLGPDVADALRDLAQISQLCVDSDDDIEENEVYWQELVEYVKVAVLTIHSELAHDQSSGQTPVVH